MAKLIYKNKKSKQSITIHVCGEATADELVEDGIKPLMLAMTYHPSNVDAALGLSNEETGEEDDE